MKTFSLVLTASIASILGRGIRAFVRPQTFATPHRTVSASVEALPSSAFLLADDAVTDAAAAADAFTDEVNLLGDPTVQIIVGVFGIAVVLLVVAKNLLGQMDIAIEKTLVEFETTMKRKYAKKWTGIETQLVGLSEEERAQKLFAIMEKLQSEEPEFMAEVKENMEN